MITIGGKTPIKLEIKTDLADSNLKQRIWFTVQRWVSLIPGTCSILIHDLYNSNLLLFLVSLGAPPLPYLYPELCPGPAPIILAVILCPLFPFGPCYTPGILSLGCGCMVVLFGRLKNWNKCNYRQLEWSQVSLYFSWFWNMLDPIYMH